jgi:molybdopterin-guanine dinucleotide biosynthesis protein A
MGLDKASLPFGNETMLARVARRLAEVVDPLVVVAAAHQELPELPVPVTVVFDRAQGQGPLEGLAAGIEALAGKVDAVYVTSCDVPLLSVDFLRLVISLLADHDVAVPKDARYFHPLAAVYRVSVLPHIESLLSKGRRRPIHLFDQVDTLEIPTARLTSADPDLLSLRNLNCPKDYVDALGIAGISMSPKLRVTLTALESNRRK